VTSMVLNPVPARGAATPEYALGGKVYALASRAYERDYLDTAASHEDQIVNLGLMATDFPQYRLSFDRPE
jgi:hypothetical protein